MILALSLAIKNDPIKLIWIVLEKNEPGIVPSLPTARAAPATPAQLTAREIPSMKEAALLIESCTSTSEEISVLINMARSPSCWAF